MTGGEPPFIATYLSKFYTIPVKMCCWINRNKHKNRRFNRLRFIAVSTGKVMHPPKAVIAPPLKSKCSIGFDLKIHIAVIARQAERAYRHFCQVGWSFYYPCPSPADAPASIHPWLALTNPLYSPFPGHSSSLSSCHIHSSSCSKSFGELIRYSIFEETVKFGKNAPA